MKLGHSPVIEGSFGGCTTVVAPPSGKVGGGAKQIPMPRLSKPQSPLGMQHARRPADDFGHCDRLQVVDGGGEHSPMPSVSTPH